MIFACGPIEVRTCAAPMAKGEIVDGHGHKFGHATVIVTGGFRITQHLKPAPGVIECWAGMRPIFIPAGVEHSLESLADGSVYFCLYAHRLPNGEVVEQYTGWEDAYG